MLKQDKNMGNLIEWKVMIMSALFFVVSFSNFENVMKAIVFILTVAFTLRRWYLMEKRNKDENN